MDFILQHAEVPKVSRRGTPRPKKYPFQDMQPGMMFFTPGAKPSTIMSLASSTGKRLGWTFQTRKQHMRLEKGQYRPCAPTDKGAVFGVAVYRTA